MRKEVELLAAKVLEDAGISLPLRLLGRKKYLRWVMRVPSLESRIRISKMYGRLEVTHEELQAFTFEQKMEFTARHGKTVSRMVAYAIVRGYFLGWILNRPVAWMLRTQMHPTALEEAFMLSVSAMNTVPFENTIRLAEMINILAPTLSQRKR